MELTKRDLEVMTALEKWGVMGLGQLDGFLFRSGAPDLERMRLFFNDLTREDHWGGAYKRLRTLVQEGLVKTFRPINYWQVYMLTGRGHERLRENQRASFMHPIQGVGEAYLRHEITVCGVGLVMTELLGLKVETARQTWEQIRRRGVLRKGDSKLTFPDLIAVDAQGDRHTIEVELTAKSRERYRELFSDRKGLWRRQQRWSDQEKCWKGGTVLYLTGWPTGVEHIIHLARKSQAGSVHAASLSDFRASLGRCEYEKLTSVGGRRKFSLTAAKAAPLAEVAA